MTSNFHTTTQLADIKLPFMDVVLAERFLLPPDSLKRFNMPIPQTIGEVAETSGLPLDKVIAILEECVALNEKVWLDGTIDAFAAQDRVWIIDMRPMVEFDVDPLHPSARIFHHGNQAQQLELMRTMEKVLVLSSSPGHAWSAAMALRQMGISAFLLKNAQ